ncbi:hypothetical protein A2U01_0055420, partial [Trifolium medium]|nr:hypothetical protein [Trifolium medium]
LDTILQVIFFTLSKAVMPVMLGKAFIKLFGSLGKGAVGRSGTSCYFNLQKPGTAISLIKHSYPLKVIS